MKTAPDLPSLPDPFPTGGFKWKKVDDINLAKYAEDNKKGLILEDDLEYPLELYNLHNEYLVVPERKK